MRFGRPAHEEEQEESAFVSMTDMMVGFLFIVMLVMVFFATQFREEDVVDRRLYEELKHRVQTLQAENIRLREENAQLQKEIALLKKRLEELLRKLKKRNPLEEYLARAIQLRRQLVEEMRRRIKALYPDLQVEISPEGDALRFQGEGLFELGSAELRPQARQIIRDLAHILDRSLACYTRNASAVAKHCPNRKDALIEAVQVEGHTDTVGPPEVNLELSTRRALSAFNEMLRTVPRLTAYNNQRDQPVMAVSGYGEMRLAIPTADNVNEPRNRRIDLRVLLYTPSTREELEMLIQRLQKHKASTSSTNTGQAASSAKAAEE